MKKIGEVFGWVFIIVAIIVMVTLFTSGRAFGREADKPSPFTLDNLSTEDKQAVSALNAEASDVQKDIQLAQLSLQIAQAKQTRINEVELPTIIQAIRDKYTLPVSDWVFDLQRFSFTKRPKAPESKAPKPPDK